MRLLHTLWFFTPPQIRLVDEGLPKFFHKRQQRWIDPCKTKLEERELQKIYDFISYVRQNLGFFEEKINKDRKGKPNTQKTAALNALIEQYQDDLKEYAAQSGFNLHLNNLFSTVAVFASPFDTIFNAKARLFLDPNRTMFHKVQGREGEYIEVKPEEFLSEAGTLVELIFGEVDTSPDRCSSYLLKAKGPEGKDRYFVLPPFRKRNYPI